MKTTKKLLALLLALTLCLGLGVTALAEDDTPMVISSNAAFTVYTAAVEGAEPVVAKSYTAEDIAALMETGTMEYGYQKPKGDDNSVFPVIATEYVTFDALIADAGVEFTEGCTVNFTCYDGPYKKSVPTYADITAAKYNFSGDEVPVVFAYTYGSTAEEAKTAENPKFLLGLSAEQLEAGKGVFGYSLPTGVTSITITYPPAFTIYSADYEGAEPKVVKSYSAADLEALMETGTMEYGYQKPKNGEGTVFPVIATEYITLDALLSDAGAEFIDGYKVNFTCYDGPYAKSVPTYADITAAKYNFNGDEVPVVLAFTYGNTAEEAKRAENPKFLLGLSAEQLEAGKGVFGYSLPTGVTSITLTYAPFADAANQWYSAAVSYAAKAGIVKGTGNGFEPKSTLTVRSFLQMLYNAAGAPNGEAKDGEDWWVPAQKWGIEQGYITADEDIAGSCNRLKAVQMFYASNGSPEVTEASSFSDCSDAAAIWAYGKKIVAGNTNGQFLPDENLTRAAAVQILYNAK